MNKIYFLFVLIVLIFSCNKKSDHNISFNNNSYTEDTNNIYHKEYTNVVKIQGKFIDVNASFHNNNSSSSDSSNFYREEGKYEKYHDIFDSIRNNSLKRVKELVEYEDFDVNEAIETDKAEYSDFMENSYNIKGATPIIFAVFYRDSGIIKYLLDRGADPFIRDDDSWNSFLWACAVGNVDTIKTLINYDKNLIKTKNDYGANGLHLAVLNGNIEVLSYLVNELGIDINSKDYDGDGVLNYAHDDNTIQVLKYLGAR